MVSLLLDHDVLLLLLLEFIVLYVQRVCGGFGSYLPSIAQSNAIFQAFHIRFVNNNSVNSISITTEQIGTTNSTCCYRMCKLEAHTSKRETKQANYFEFILLYFRYSLQNFRRQTRFPYVMFCDVDGDIYKRLGFLTNKEYGKATGQR